MSIHRQVDRRVFLARAGRLGIGLMLSATAVACATDGSTDVAGTGSTSEAGPPSDGGATPPGAASAAASTPTGSAVDWNRIDLGFVSAYLLVKQDEVVVVDTGTEDSATDIEAALDDLGLGWYAVTDVILTHRHPDHIGSLPEVLDATNAQAHAGEEDIIGIGGSQPIAPLADGDDVAGLQIITTPGHTPGHISVYDPVGRVLVAGDALVGRADGGGVAGPDAAYTQDMDTAHASVRKLATFDVETLLFGHGEPVEQDAGRLLAELAERL